MERALSGYTSTFSLPQKGGMESTPFIIDKDTFFFYAPTINRNLFDLSKFEDEMNENTNEESIELEVRNPGPYS